MHKSYDPNSFETRLYQWWESSGFFRAADESSKPSFCIPMPPPNITGVLHNGHALGTTLQDVLIRWKRMSGFNALWMPGTDHAGIATQMVVERELAKEKKSRHDMGRKAFVETIWKWKDKHGAIIVQQMRKLGASPDWSRERFTMDEGLSKAVREVFVRLYEEQHIYRGLRLINWCHRCQTALSDLEVVPTEKKGHFYHIQYAPGIVIATTRPETLLGDTAVAVHPEDERYKKKVGTTVKVPLIGRAIPVIADAYVDKEFGSGALKVTPGHDFNDYEIGQRHSLPTVSVFDAKGKVNENGGPYRGLSISEAREKVVADLQEKGILIKTEEHTHSVGVCQRCERVVEPMLSYQWFMKMKPFAEKAIDAVKKGEKISLAELEKRDDAIKLFPDTWLATYYHWMENIRDWCVSRQLWWGHQIPAWYCKKCSHVTVSRTDVSKCEKCGSSEVEQDPDVLDTWFSSGLWPFSTLGWPEKTKALKTFYPASVLETGFDILFFWVARMIMMGMHFNDGKVPFRRVYLHAMVRDEKGQKMSKTKGNVIDPLDIIRDYGADAFRFTLAAMAGQGRDIKLSLDRIEGYKTFCNKLWNASRYVLMRLGAVSDGEASTSVDFGAVTKGKTLEEWMKVQFQELHPVNKWIVSRLQNSIANVEKGLEEYRLNDAANELYHFIWNDYCDWYIEFSKELLSDSARVQETQVCLLYVLEQILALAHPFVPFVTEEIFSFLPARVGVKKGQSLMLNTFPKSDSKLIDSVTLEKVSIWQDSITALRAFRGENNVSPKARPQIKYRKVVGVGGEQLMEGVPFIKALAQLGALDVALGQESADSSIGQIAAKGATFYVELRGLVDFSSELKRLEKERSQLLSDIDFVRQKLSKESFISKAPPELVAKEREKLAGYESQLETVDLTIQKTKELVK